MYIFIDPNQALYRRHVNLPVKDEPHYLTTNCRNTLYIHKAAYRYFQGQPTDPPEIKGTELIRMTGRSIEEQSSHVAREINRLITSEDIGPRQVVVLVLGRPKDQYYSALAKHSLVHGTRWTIEVHETKELLMDTVKRFKGLEACDCVSMASRPVG